MYSKNVKKRLAAGVLAVLAVLQHVQCHRLFVYSAINALPDTRNTSYRRYDDPSNKWNPNSPRRFSTIKSNRINESEQGTNLNALRIFGGENVTAGQFPFMAVVHRLVSNELIDQCGGTIISKRWVLTAGHCTMYRPRRFLVSFGVTANAAVGYDFHRTRGISMFTKRAFCHPNYNVLYNDIGLLYMPRDIPFSSTIQPISLAGRDYQDETFANRIGQVIGWGHDGPTSGPTQILKYAILPIISNSECKVYWSVTEKNICTAPGVGKNACQGDSGGPLIIMTDARRPLQVGIVSYGDKYCPSKRPGVLTRISELTDYIEAVSKLKI